MEIKLEVFNYLKEVYANNPDVDFNFRTLINALEIRLAFPVGWEDIVNNSIQ